MHSILKAVLIGVIPVAVVDFRSFAAARKKDRTVTFDWVYAFSNWAGGAIGGAGIGMGLDSLG